MDLSQQSLGLVAATATTAAAIAMQLPLLLPPLLGLRGPSVDLRQWSWEWQPLGLGSPGPVSFMVLVAWRYRDKQGPQSTSEMIAGGAHHLWEAVVFNGACRGGCLCVLSERSRLWLLSETEV